MNEQKPLGYVVTAAANRLQNGGVTEYIQSEKPSGDPPCRAVFLHPDPSADKLRARIRVLEAEAKTADERAKEMKHDAEHRFGRSAEQDRLIEDLRRDLAAESRKVGELQTQLDALVTDRLHADRDWIAANNFVARAIAFAEAFDHYEASNGDVKTVASWAIVQRARKELDIRPTTFSEPSIGAAEWLDAHCPDGWDCYEVIGWGGHRWLARDKGGPEHDFGTSPLKAREALARALGWTGGQKAQGPAVAAPGAARTPPVGSRGGSGTPTPPRATSCEGTALQVSDCTPVGVDSDIEKMRHQKAEVNHTREGRDCSTCLLGEEPDAHPGCVGCHGVDGNPRWQAERKPEEKTDRPKWMSDFLRIEDGLWKGLYRRVRAPKPDRCPLPADVSGWKRPTQRHAHWYDGLLLWEVVVYPDDHAFRVFYDHGLVAMAPCRTPEGGLRLGVKAARRAWRLRNGGGK
ncbi:MAG: hypothetical protein WDA27_14290 [Actinomycetota bacterium]